MISEKLLITKVKKGNPKAFRKLFELYFVKLFRFLSQFSRDKDQVEDWVQNAFIKAYENIDSFAYRSKFSTWLFTIAINEMRSSLRTINRRSEYHSSQYSEELGSDTEPEFHWEHDMKYYLDQLSNENKLIFMLYEVEGYSHREISEMLGIAETTCRSKLFRTKKVLRQEYLKNEKE